ncbi:transcription termination factor 3, mitochondrial isoform X1 [Clarias magur]|uniref:GATA zinc finger domain-containing protein 1 n=1 Tax=Clarias magur TaxID=1594786 RepID=A0A8J4UJM7_CLAMG|nr:transcription termination factor 3, mitochondrial isoform X1 [Clarias magur]
MPLGLKPCCAVCKTNSSSMWKKGNLGEILCNNCTAKSTVTGASGLTVTSSTQQSNGGGKQSKQEIHRRSARLRSTKYKAPASEKKVSSKGKGRRHIFKLKNPIKAPESVSTIITSESIFYKGVYYQIGDVIKVIDEEDGKPYFAQIRGFIQDQYCEKSAALTWLIPTQSSPRDHFDPGTYILDLDALSCPSPFEEISDEDAVQIFVPPNLPPATITLRDFVDTSETLKNLVHLGVNLSKLEERPNVGSMLVRLDFQKDVVPLLLFLKDLGVQDVQLGPMLTKNPFVLTESLENLQTRVSYLKSKKFSSEAVAVMVSKAPYLLNFSVKRLDNRLGFFQQQLGLSAHKTRDVVTRLPRLLCGSLEPVKENLRVCELEFGFHRNEIQHIVTVIPKVLTANKRKLTQIFDFVHNTMGVPHALITKFPQVLNAKFLRIRERHLFLEYLGRAHYDPTHPNYIPLERLVALPDETFCTKVALSSLNDFERFQKMM